MKNCWRLLFFVFIIIIVANLKTCFAIYEPFSSKSKLVLMGDSIFKNQLFVPKGKSVESLLKKKLGADKVSVFAEDGATIFDLNIQIRSLTKKYNNKNTHIFLSFGGNDIIENFIDSYTGVTLQQLFNDYKKNISKLTYKLPNAKIYLTTIYYPKAAPYLYYQKVIKSWNKMIISYAKKNKWGVLRLDNLFKKKADFTNSIEPSMRGGKIITNNVGILLN